MQRTFSWLALSFFGGTEVKSLQDVLALALWRFGDLEMIRRKERNLTNSEKAYPYQGTENSFELD